MPNQRATLRRRSRTDMAAAVPGIFFTYPEVAARLNGRLGWSRLHDALPGRRPDAQPAALGVHEALGAIITTRNSRAKGNRVGSE